MYMVSLDLFLKKMDLGRFKDYKRNVQTFMMNLYHLFENAVGRFGSRPFLVQHGRVWTYNKMYQEVQESVSSKRFKEMPQHFRFCHRGSNSPALVCDALATWKAGGIFVPLASSLPSQTEAFMRCLVRSVDQSNAIASPPIRDHQPLKDTALFLFTSGTTATPKAVVLTHENVMSNLIMIGKRIPDTLINHEHSSFAFLPWYHSYGLTCELLFLMSRGACIHLPSSSSPNPAQFMKELSQANPSLLFTVPRFLQKIQKTSERTMWWMPNRFQKYLLFGNRLERLCVGGAKIDSNALQFFKNSWNLPIHQGYGCTETSPMISLQSDTDIVEKSSCGRLLEGTAAYLTSQGELCVRGPQVCHGYLSPENTLLRPPEQFLHDGFFNTRDVCTLDHDQRVMFKYRDASHWKLQNGKFVDPGHIENALLTLPGIEQCVIIGNHESHLQVCIYHERPISAEKLFQKIKKHLLQKGFAPYEIPTRVHLLVEPLSQKGGTLSLKQEPLRNIIQQTYFHKPVY